MAPRIVPDTLPVYGWLDAKRAYESGERQFCVYPRYPMFPQPGYPTCEKCERGCDFVHFDHRANGALVIRCKSCGCNLKGGKYEVGINSKVANRDSGRLFGPVLRDEVLRRDARNGQCRCWRCGATPETDELEIDHIIPYAMGGPTELLNAVTLCKTCNSAKSDRYDEEFVTNALVYTHRMEFGSRGSGTDSTRRVLKSVANSLIAWRLWGKDEQTGA